MGGYLSVGWNNGNRFGGYNPPFGYYQRPYFAPVYGPGFGNGTFVGVRGRGFSASYWSNGQGGPNPLSAIGNTISHFFSGTLGQHGNDRYVTEQRPQAPQRILTTPDGKETIIGGASTEIDDEGETVAAPTGRDRRGRPVYAGSIASDNNEGLPLFRGQRTAARTPVETRGVVTDGAKRSFADQFAEVRGEAEAAKPGDGKVLPQEQFARKLAAATRTSADTAYFEDEKGEKVEVRRAVPVISPTVDEAVVGAVGIMQKAEKIALEKDGKSIKGSTVLGYSNTLLNGKDGDDLLGTASLSLYLQQNGVDMSKVALAVRSQATPDGQFTLDTGASAHLITMAETVRRIKESGGKLTPQQIAAMSRDSNDIADTITSGGTYSVSPKEVAQAKQIATQAEEAFREQFASR